MHCPAPHSEKFQICYIAEFFSTYLFKIFNKPRELFEIAEDLKMVFDLPASGNLPVRCNGIRWISHKQKALQCLLDRYGAYINHLGTYTIRRSKYCFC